MKKQEDGPVLGGVLADEMGMGKTIQTIALMLAHSKAAALEDPEVGDYLVVSYLVVSYLVVSYLVLSCLVVSCLVLSDCQKIRR